MNKLVVALLVMSGVSRVQAQNTAGYKFSDDIRQEMLKNKSGANQYAAWDYSYIGQYQAALRAWDNSNLPASAIPAADSLAFVALKPTDAHRYIISRARNERILIINEAHHNPRHRALTASLLPDLAKLGFQYFAAEALDAKDLQLNKRGYPVLQTGYYIKEPQFGHLLRTAARNGFKMAAYEYDSEDHKGDAEARVEARETAQARNIQRILQADPNAKIVVHCGFSHVNEGPKGMGEQMAMAGRLRALMGINPFTIDQTALTEAGSPGGEAPVYRLAKAPTSAVFLTAQNSPYAAADEYMSVDVNVYHPRTTYRAGRPDWVFTTNRQPVPITKTITVGFPCLVLAYAAEEDKTRAVPVDIVELQAPQDKKALALAKGKYTIIARSRNGKSESWTIVK